MASIHKLSVRGIRAFSPDDEEQVISFCFPLTIIIGANGCGKTTIIEALKYAITGSLPPGNKSGQAFVHDPKSAGSSVVKAAVKLRFTNRAGKSMVVVRSMELTQKKTTMSFKALDGILRTTDEHGNRQSLSHKCSELDRQIPQLLGVSKPILEHVVFCHQEDSSWPLREGAVLKKYFDDIFDSTKYVKALDAIKDTRKQYMNKVKDHKAELGELNGHKHAAQGFRQELNKAGEALSDITDEMREFQEQIESEQARQAEFLKIIKKKDDLQGKAESVENEIDQLQAKLKEKRKHLEEDLTKNPKTNNLDALETMLLAFKETVENDEKRLRDKEHELNDIKNDISQLQQKIMETKENKGLLMGQKSSYDKALVRRLQSMESMHTRYGLELPFSPTQDSQHSDNTESSEGLMGTQQSRTSVGNETTTSVQTGTTLSTVDLQLSEEDLSAFRSCIETKRNELQKRLNNHREESERMEEKLQKELSALTAERLSTENEMKRCREERQKAMNELRSIKSSSSKVRRSDIDDLKRQKEKFSKLRDDLNNDPRKEQIPREIKEKQDEIEKLRESIDTANSALKDLRKCAEEQNAIEILERQISQDLEVMEELKTENSYTLSKYNVMPNGSMEADNIDLLQITDDLELKLEEKFESAKYDLEETERKQQTISNRLSEKSALLKNNQKSLFRWKDQLARLRDGGVQEIKKVTNYVREADQSLPGNSTLPKDISPQDLLEYMTTRIGELSNDNDKPEMISRTIEKLVRLARKSAEETGYVKCPCCRRNMEEREAEIFTDEMDKFKDPDRSPLITKSTQISTALRNFEEWRNIVSQNLNAWLDYNRISADIKRVESTISREESDEEELRKELEDSKSDRDAADITVSELQQLLEIARRFKDDAHKVSKKRDQIATRKEELSLIAPKAKGKDLRVIEREYSTNNEKKDDLMNAITTLNVESSELNDQISRASNKAARAEDMVKAKIEQFEEEQQKAKRKQELTESIEQVKDRETKMQKQIAPIRQNEKTKETQKLRQKEGAKSTEEDLRSTLSSFDNDAENIAVICNQIDEFASSDTLKRLSIIDSQVSTLEGDIKKKQEVVQRIEPELTQLKKLVDERGRQEANVRRNMEVLKGESELEDLKDKVDLINVKIEDLDQDDTASNEYEDAANNIRKYERDKTRREGSIDALKVQQRDLQRKLRTKEYDDIDERHRVKMIEHETCSLAVQDLELYHSALDKALLRYHGRKIEDINKIIQELWTLTYKGEDITSIRLTSDQQTGSRATRSYNYRVVMTKGTTELDMRGRCSAGQRVLASIVIRLALAETFCLNCGVMALDEPTTNLDYANKRGLAIALAQIIASRASQENFQLVTITHDEEFVSMMKTELAAHTGFAMPERYFEVSREVGIDGSYYSKIHAIDWDEI